MNAGVTWPNRAAAVRVPPRQGDTIDPGATADARLQPPHRLLRPTSVPALIYPWNFRSSAGVSTLVRSGTNRDTGGSGMPPELQLNPKYRELVREFKPNAGHL